MERQATKYKIKSVPNILIWVYDMTENTDKRKSLFKPADGAAVLVPLVHGPAADLGPICALTV